MTHSSTDRSLSTEHQLDEVATRLADKEGHPDALRRRTIAAWVQDAAAQFIGAPVQAYVPVLVEHIVRELISVPRSTASPGTRRLGG